MEVKAFFQFNFSRHEGTRTLRRIRRERSDSMVLDGEEAGEVGEPGRRCSRGKVRTGGGRHSGGGDGEKDERREGK